MHANADVVISIIAEKVAPIFVRDLKKKSGRLASGDIEQFSSEMGDLLTNAFFEVSHSLGIENLDELGEEIMIKIRGYLVACLNGALPENHPYIIGLTKIKSEAEWGYVPMYRHHHAIFHEMLSSNVVPLVLAETREALEAGDVTIQIFHDGEEISE